MAKAKFIFQAATPVTHAVAIRRLLEWSDAVAFVGCFAYANKQGVDGFAAHLAPVATNTTFLIGVRNGATTRQGLKRLLDLGVNLYVVDTGTRYRIFHPKLFAAYNEQHAKIMIGSANLTFPGLNNNVEASAFFDLDLSDNADAEFLAALTGQIQSFIRQYPDHVVQISAEDQLHQLLKQERIEDEDKEDVHVGPARSKAAPKDQVGLMKLHTVKRPPRPRRTKRPVSRGARKGALTGVDPATLKFQPVWESDELNKRDLGIPTGTNTSRTGSMLMKKGLVEGIDQRHFFREEVFAALTWDKQTGKPSELATGRFWLRIKGKDFGWFDLTLRHNTDKDSVTYRQNNGMTHLRWGQAQPHLEPIREILKSRAEG